MRISKSIGHKLSQWGSSLGSVSQGKAIAKVKALEKINLRASFRSIFKRNVQTGDQGRHQKLDYLTHKLSKVVGDANKSLMESKEFCLINGEKRTYNAETKVSTPMHLNSENQSMSVKDVVGADVNKTLQSLNEETKDTYLQNQVNRNKGSLAVSFGSSDPVGSSQEFAAIKKECTDLLQGKNMEDKLVDKVLLMAYEGAPMASEGVLSGFVDKDGLPLDRSLFGYPDKTACKPKASVEVTAEDCDVKLVFKYELTLPEKMRDNDYEVSYKQDSKCTIKTEFLVPYDSSQDVMVMDYEATVNIQITDVTPVDS